MRLIRYAAPKNRTKAMNGLAAQIAMTCHFFSTSTQYART